MSGIYAENSPLVEEVAAAKQIVAGDNGKIFLQTSATAGFTLPPVADVWNGWNVTIFNKGATSLIVTAPATKLMGFNNAACATVTFNTGSHIIGAAVKIVYFSTTAKYACFIYGHATATMS